ncbi:MAG: hypothetical protein WC201_02065 [Bacilli bacterium]
MDQSIKKVGKRKINFSAFANVAVFFTFEVLAFIAFSLGTSYILYSVLSLVLLIVLLLVTIRQLNKDGLATYAFFLFPIFVYGLLNALSIFSQDSLFVLNGLAFLIPIGMTCFAACGYLVSAIKSFNIGKALFVIYSALAILTLINLFATMIEFAPFYTLLYRDKYIYYNGAISEVPISQMAFALLGFSVSEVSVEYFSLFPSLLLSAVIPLFFLKFKENKTIFLLYTGYVFLGFISLLMTVSKITLISDFLVFIVVVLVLLFAKFNWKGKILKIILIIFGCFFILGFIVMFLNAQEDAAGLFASVQNVISNNAILDRLFNGNGLVIRYNAILNWLMKTNSDGQFVCLFGFVHTSDVYPSNSWFFDNLMTSGIFGSIFFLFFVIVGIRRLIIYFRQSQDLLPYRAMLVAFVLSFFAFSLINYDATPYIFSKTLSPIYLSGPFLVVLFLMSYAIYQTVNNKKNMELDLSHSQVVKTPISEEGDNQNETISL